VAWAGVDVKSPTEQASKPAPALIIGAKPAKSLLLIPPSQPGGVRIIQQLLPNNNAVAKRVKNTI